MPSSMSNELVNVTVISNVNEFESLRRFPANLPLSDLKSKLELLTGIGTSFMQLELLTSERKMVGKLENMSVSLAESGITDNMVLLVKDPTGKSSLIGSSNAVPKFELSEEQYEQRTDSVLAWKQRNKLGRFDAEAAKSKADQEQEIITKSAQLAKNIKVGDRCQVSLPNRPVKRGVVSFVGTTKFKSGHWVGVTYDEPVGKNDGSVDGVKYFTCSPKYGGMVRPHDMKVGDFPPEFDDEMDEI